MVRQKRQLMEKDIETYLGKRVKSANGMTIKIFPMGNNGLPDRLVLMPYGRAYFVELKDTGKKPRPLQVRVHRALRELGFTVRVIDSKEGVDEFIESIMEGGDAK